MLEDEARRLMKHACVSEEETLNRLSKLSELSINFLMHRSIKISAANWHRCFYTRSFTFCFPYLPPIASIWTKNLLCISDKNTSPYKNIYVKGTLAARWFNPVWRHKHLQLQRHHLCGNPTPIIRLPSAVYQSTSALTTEPHSPTK